MKRILFYTIAVLAALLLVFASAVLWLLGTNSGARWTIGRISQFTGVTFQMQSIEGSFLSGLSLDGLSVTLQDVSVDVRKLKLQWQPMDLLIGQLGFTELTVTGARIQDDRKEEEEKKEKTSSPAGFSLPSSGGKTAFLPVRIRFLGLRDITYRRLDRTSIRINNAEARVRFSGGRISLTNMILEMPEFSASGGVIAGLSRPSLRMDMSVIPAKPAAGMDEFKITTDLGPAKTPLQLKGPITFAGYADSKSMIEFETEIALAKTYISLNNIQVRQPGRGGSVTGQAEYIFAAEKTGFHGRLFLNDLDISKEVPFTASVSGSVGIAGNTGAYEGSISLIHKGTGWKTGSITADFSGTASAAQFTSIKGDWLNGSISGSVRADWKKFFSVSVSLKTRNMDPALVAGEWSGSVNMDIDAAVRLPANRKPEGTLSLRLRESRVRGRPLTGRLDARLKHGVIGIGQLALAGKGFNIRATGELTRRIDFVIGLTDLSVLKPEAEGRAEIKGWIRKTKQNFTGSVTAEAADVYLGGMRASSLNVSGRIEDSEGVPFSLSISIRDGTHKLLRFDSLSANASGTLHKHVIRASMRSSVYSISVRMTGAFIDDGWRGTVIRFSGSDAAGTWKTTAPVELLVEGGRFSLSPLVLSGAENERIELQAMMALSPLSGSFSMDWRNIDLSRANVWISGMTLAGQISGRIAGKIDTEGRLDIVADSSLSGASITRRIQNLELKADLRKAELSATWQGAAIEGKVSLTFAEYGQIEANLLAPVPARLPVVADRNGPLRLGITGTVREAGTLSFLFPGVVQKTRGSLAVNIVATGTWGSPELRGTLQLDHAEGYFPAAGITVTDIQVDARIEQSVIRIESFSAKSGPGRVTGKATITLEGLRPARYEGSLRGERFQALLLPHVRMQINPDITFRKTPEKLSTAGEVILPELLIYGAPPREEASPVQPSGDVVIVGATEDRETAPAETVMETDINIKVILGDRVIVKARGIDAQLRGEVALTGGSSGEVTGEGEIRTTRGRYSIYGVNLDISRGRLLFAGGPADNPSLDILAVRTVDTVKAGVLLRGTLKKPEVKLYSEPAMPDADILAYVVLGRPLGQDKEQSDLLMRVAAVLLSAGQSVALQDQIKNRLGIDTIDIEAGEGEDESRSLVTIGKYLSTRLYISYGYALFSGGSLFRMRYRFGKKWELESRSGETSGVDLYYTIWLD